MLRLNLGKQSCEIASVTVWAYVRKVVKLKNGGKKEAFSLLTLLVLQVFNLIVPVEDWEVRKEG